MNSIDWLVAYFGIIRTGAWAVPLSFRFTSGEIKRCADTAEARAMILGEEFKERVEITRTGLSTIEVTSLPVRMCLRIWKVSRR